MATAIPGFDADEFRAGIRLAMTVGLPPLEADQPLFVFPRQVVNTAPADQDGVPFDPDARPVAAIPVSVRVSCAVEYDDTTGRVENMGVITPSVVKLTLLDEEYAQIRGFEYVVIAGDKYLYRLTEPPVGMDTVAVWTVHCVAEDDT